MKEEKKEKARVVLCRMFNVEDMDIVFMKSRKRNRVDARKFYNYYLWKCLEIKHNQMKNHIYGMHHATSIHFKNKLEFEIEHYNEIHQEWTDFLFFTDHDEWNKLTHIKEAKSKYII